MNIYVESNFVLELALMQEEYNSCESILGICSAVQARLIIPAFCITEPYETIIRRRKDRTKLYQNLTSEFAQLSRSIPYKAETDSLQNLISLLIRSAEEEKQRLDQVRDRILQIAEIIPLGKEIFLLATMAQTRFDFSPQDSIVYASVLHHLSNTNADKSCFLNRNSRDFSDPDIEDVLRNYNCKIIFSFKNGYRYIQSQI